MRLDQYLVLNKYFESRNKAQNEIDSGNVLVNNKVITKGSFDVKDNDIIEIKDSCPYVSRGGYKLEEALKKFNIDLNNKVVLDIGASTGGFTDCSIQNGAKLVYSVDVGTNQLHESLLNNPQIISYEKTNILDLNPSYLKEKPEVIVMDVSFVSIEYLLPGILKFLDDKTIFISLIKPQFEVGNMKFKNGVIKDKNIHIKVIENVRKELNKNNLDIFKLIPSPIKGGSGNREFLVLIKNGFNNELNIIKSIEE